jgi:hypothetical protein
VSANAPFKTAAGPGTIEYAARSNRRTALLRKGDQTSVILLQLLRPARPENDYPRSFFRLLIDGRIEETEVSGVHSICCIAMALVVAGTKITWLNEAVYGNKLRWEGSSGDGDIGLPTIENSPLARGRYAEAERWALTKRGLMLKTAPMTSISSRDLCGAPAKIRHIGR